MTFTHHGATECHQHNRCETIFFRAKQCGNRQVTTRPQLTIRLHTNATTQPITTQQFVRFRKSQLPRQSDMFDGSQRGCPCAAVMTGYQHHIRAGLCDTGRDGPYACLGD